MLLSILVVIFQLVHYFREPGISIYSTNFLGDKIVTTCSVIDEISMYHSNWIPNRSLLSRRQ